MPELPEVETIRKGIVDKLKGKKIANIEIKVPKLFIGNPRDICGAKIIGARRVAKILEIVLDNSYSILVHLKLTGQLIYQGQIGNFTHLTYNFSDGTKLIYNDLRKFGWHKVVKTDEVNEILGNDKFGPEPGTKAFSIEYLKNIFSKTTKPIKIVLMDQQKIGGIGNIYANDGLYWAEILPTRPAKSLSDIEIKKLKQAVEKVINLGLKFGGSSENTYVNIEGKKGSYMEHSAVYQKKQDPKGHPLKRIKIGGRGTFYCPRCQK
jgi:formamidopyrimidine-DNA glycosylase